MGNVAEERVKIGERCYKVRAYLVELATRLYTNSRLDLTTIDLRIVMEMLLM